MVKSIRGTSRCEAKECEDKKYEEGSEANRESVHVECGELAHGSGRKIMYVYHVVTYCFLMQGLVVTLSVSSIMISRE